MKNFAFLGLFLCCSLAYGQLLKPVAQKVYDYTLHQKSYPQYDLFSEGVVEAKTGKYGKSAQGVTVFKLRTEVLSKLRAEKPEGMEISFPYEGKSITLQLIKTNILTDDFLVKTQSGKKFSGSANIFYEGIVKGDQTSVVSFSFFEDEVVGVAAVKELGNIVVARAKDTQEFISYSDQNLNAQIPYICGTETLADNLMRNVSSKVAAAPAVLTDNCVRIYFETTYSIFKMRGNDVKKVTDWVMAMFNNVKTIYRNDGINIALSEIFVWDVTDAAVYKGQKDTELLDQFRNHRTSFNGDVGQLLRFPPIEGGVAFQDVLCVKSYNYSYTGVFDYYDDFPLFSWNIMGMAHELGHALASPHTHNCAWNNNKTAIDGCGYGVNPNEKSCPGPVPSAEEGGTIMSYCHVKGNGIKFTNGFGPQPAALIRSRVNSRACLGTNCTTSCETTATVGVNSLSSNALTATLFDGVASNSSWKYALTKTDGAVVRKGNSNSKNLSFSGLSPNTYYELQVGNLCSGPEAYNQKLLLLTDENWCGKTFTDSGGTTRDYGNSESFVKTFFPPSGGGKLILTFKEFDLEETHDRMFIYNGNSQQAPLFENGKELSGNKVPSEPFVSTDASGAITIAFYSDGNATKKGWVAQFTCTTLSVDEAEAKDGITVYPNPAKNILNVESAEAVEAYSVADLSGRTLMEKSKVGSKKFSIDFSALTPGVYFVSFKLLGKNISKKVIKK